MSFAVDCLLPTFEHVYRELNPENLGRILRMLYYESRSKIEDMCMAVGFDIVKSFEVKMDDFVYENVESMYSFIWATFQGAFDRQLVTKDRLARFCARYTSGENSKPFKVFAVEGDYICVLIAAKPARK